MEVTDTAGMRSTNDIIETEGINRAIKAIETADLVLCLFDERHRLIATTPSKASWKHYEHHAGFGSAKIDIKPKTNQEPHHLSVGISAKTGEGLGEFQSWLLKKLNLTTHCGHHI